MNAGAVLLLAIAGVVSACDWFAVLRRNKSMEYVCKPAAALLFALAAVVLDPSSDSARAWTVAALVLCIVGDVFLMLPRDAFVPGLASFAIAQVLFAVSFLVRDVDSTRLILGLVIVVLATAVLARRFISALRRTDRTALVVPVVFYMMVISLMAVASISAGTPIGIIGALLFMVSDSLIAEERFVRQCPWQPLTIIVTYHLALTGLVLGLV